MKTSNTGTLKNGQSRETSNTGDDEHTGTQKGQSRETSNTGYTRSKMNNPRALATHGTIRLSKMDNPEKLATQGTPAIKNGQSRETSNTGYTCYQKWTIQRN